MADTPAVAARPSYDAQGREVFTVDPAILSGGAHYRKVNKPAAEDDQTAAAARRAASDTDR
jgi:hypothetical protein